MAEQPSDALMDFAFFALDHATYSIVPDGGPLVPFAVTDVGGERSLSRFVGDLTESQSQAREAIRQTQGLRFAGVAWDGFLTVDGHKSDAVFVEASEVGAPLSVMLAQRYVSEGRLRKRTKTVGNPVLVERGAALF